VLKKDIHLSFSDTRSLFIVSLFIFSFHEKIAFLCSFHLESKTKQNKVKQSKARNTGALLYLALKKIENKFD